MGPPGSGKSTQGKLLAKNLNLPHLSTGNLFRDIAQKDTPLAREVQASLQRGELVSDEVMIQLLREELNLPEYEEGVVLDGYPRTVTQAESFDYPITQVIYLKLADATAQERLLSRAKLEDRPDDNAEVIKRRLETYHQETAPVLNYYEKQNLLTRVDASPDIETIHQNIRSFINGGVSELAN